MGRILKAFSNKGTLKKASCVYFIVFSFFLSTAIAWSAVADYLGAYYGTYTGLDDGYWGGGVTDIAGDMGLLTWSTNNQVIDYSDVITIDDDGNFAGTMNSGIVLNGTIDLAGNVDGTWTGGTLTGQRFGPADIAQFVDEYSGTYSGDDDGTWSITVNAEGQIFGTITPSSGGGGTLQGGIFPDGRFLVIETTEGFLGAFGTIVGTVVTGVWSDSDTGESGTLTNQSGGGGGGDTGGGGGGGCFISTLSH